ncbi:hypothetical protein D3Y57_13625 [Sphingomonas paeninsulae]|jgi:hypothetical protein|uniref:Uncharacterized protein n=1 Tax=Sphingomonas paeninsulae TaxID=2319844 RepID=A0A494TIJ5_SPHPE|nr:hypothetical protein [Sphingomonas paeninsulae]AYJ86803.1 hypothetical protein D3Y57_13625 [Sphingomonas paeninsulae]
MKFSSTLLALAALTGASSALAQTAPAPTPAEASAQAGVANANNAAAAQAIHQSNMNAADQARYDEDRAAYIAARRARHHEAAVDAQIYDRQQRAYADAMYAWRIQVADCKRGHQAACKAPTPDPANFW